MARCVAVKLPNTFAYLELKEVHKFQRVGRSHRLTAASVYVAKNPLNCVRSKIVP